MSLCLGGMTVMGAALLAALRQGRGFDPAEDWRISVALLVGAAIGALGLAGEGARRNARPLPTSTG